MEGFCFVCLKCAGTADMDNNFLVLNVPLESNLGRCGFRGSSHLGIPYNPSKVRNTLLVSPDQPVPLYYCMRASEWSIQ